MNYKLRSAAAGMLAMAEDGEAVEPFPKSSSRFTSEIKFCLQ